MPTRGDGLRITSIAPSRALAGQGDTVVTIRGFGFVVDPLTHIRTFAVWASGVADGGVDLFTLYVSDTHVLAIIPAHCVADPVTAELFVVNGDVNEWKDKHGGYPTSNSAVFSVTAR